MPLNDEQRLKMEDVIMDLHFTSQKYIDSGKDIHKKLLQVNIEEAVQVLDELSEDVKDDEKKHDYKLHLLLPLQLYELIRVRETEE